MSWNEAEVFRVSSTIRLVLDWDFPVPVSQPLRSISGFYALGLAEISYTFHGCFKAEISYTSHGLILATFQLLPVVFIGRLCIKVFLVT